MRRVPAILLLFLFSLTLITPILSAARPQQPDIGESKLPPCCRRDGKHRCGMANIPRSKATSAESSVDAGRMRCPLYPKGESVPAAQNQTWVSAVAVTTIEPVLTLATALEQNQARYRLSYARTSQKRGPPSFLS